MKIAKIIIYRGLGIATGVTLALSTYKSVQADEPQAKPAHFPWSHNGPFQSLDAIGIRRGYQVYKQVCAGCHSMNYVCYRNLVGVSHTEEEAKAEAQAAQILDVNPEGNFFRRPGTLADRFPMPYETETIAMSMNNGALPPDLSYIVLARKGHEDYLFSLLTGYCDPPAGIEVDEGQYYNPYMAGGKIAMPIQLYDGMLDYDDGTPAYASQMAKDVSVFLKWAGEPEHDQRKKMALKICLTMPSILASSYYLKRRFWSAIKTRKFAYAPKN